LKVESWGSRSREPVFVEFSWAWLNPGVHCVCVALELVSCWHRVPPTDSPTSKSGYPKWPARPDCFLKTGWAG
jgi:hypothetical protein